MPVTKKRKNKNQKKSKTAKRKNSVSISGSRATYGFQMNNAENYSGFPSNNNNNFGFSSNNNYGFSTSVRNRNSLKNNNFGFSPSTSIYNIPEGRSPAASPAVGKKKKQGGKNNTKRRGGKKKSITKRKGGNKKTKRGGGETGETARGLNVKEAIAIWEDRFGKGKVLPHEAMKSVEGHVRAQEEADPRYSFFQIPSRVLHTTIKSIEQAKPRLAFPQKPIDDSLTLPPQRVIEEKNRMIMEHYKGIPNSGSFLPMKFKVSGNHPVTRKPFTVTYEDTEREKDLFLEAVVDGNGTGDVEWRDESWSILKRYQQTFKFPRSAPILEGESSRILELDAPPYDERRGDILLAIDPSNNKIIVEIGEVTRFPITCGGQMYSNPCFRIFFKTPREIEGPYELTLPPNTVIRVIRGKKKTDPFPITHSDYAKAKADANNLVKLEQEGKIHDPGRTFFTRL